MRAILWTPEELIAMDLAPLRARYQRDLNRLDDRNASSAAPLLLLARRWGAAVALLDMHIGWVRGLQPHDGEAARALVARVQTHGPAGAPPYLPDMVAQYVAYRLCSHRLPDPPLLRKRRPESAVLRRALELHRAGALITLAENTAPSTE
jgi:hypothetical protein